MSLFHQRAPLVRPRGTQRPAKFVIAVEGEKTEKRYFQHFASPRVEMLVLSTEQGHSSPTQVRDRLVDHCQTHETKLREGLDELWLVVDVDRHERHGHLSAIVDDMKEHGYRVAVSNPCFETWLLLHFTDEIDAAVPCKKAKKAVRRERHQRGLDGEGDPRVLAGLPDAVARARVRHDASATWPQAPGSDVFLLIEALGAAGVLEVEERLGPTAR